METNGNATGRGGKWARGHPAGGHHGRARGADAARAGAGRARGVPAWCVPLLLLLCLTPPARAEKAILDDATEAPPAGMIRPPPPLVRLVIGAFDADGRRQIDDCLLEDKLPRGDYAALLRAVRVPAGGDHALWYVRPARQPWCFPLYGVHTYHYDLVMERPLASPRYRILIDGDGFGILPRSSHGLNDVTGTWCTMGRCGTARMAFNGRKYRVVGCSETVFAPGRRDVTRPWQCHAGQPDGGMSDQSLGIRSLDGR